MLPIVSIFQFIKRWKNFQALRRFYFDIHKVFAGAWYRKAICISVLAFGLRYVPAVHADFALVSDVSPNAEQGQSLMPLDLIRPLQDNSGDGFADNLDYAQLVALSDPNIDNMLTTDGQEIGLLNLPPDVDDRFWRIRPNIGVGVTYDDNIFITHNDRRSDFIGNINVGFAFEMGDYRERSNNFLALEFQATGFFFGEYTNQNSISPQVSFMGQYRFNQITCQFESSCQFTNGADRQVGTFTDRTIYTNTLRFIYPYSTKTDLDLELSQGANVYPDSISSYNYAAGVGFNYSLFPKTKIGLQGLLGLAEVEDGPDRFFQTLNARASYEVTGKVVLKSALGVQFNEYSGGGESLRILPVFSLGADYLLFPKTNLALQGYRNLQASPGIEGQDYIATGGEISLKQNFSDKLVFSTTVGYENDTYVANTSATSASRKDNYVFFRPKISYLLMKKLQLSVFYEYRANESTLSQDSWFNNRINFQISSNF